MSELINKVSTEVRKTFEEQSIEAIKVNLENGEKTYANSEEMNELVNTEITKAVNFYLNKNKINYVYVQSIKIVELAVEKINSESVLTVNKIKHMIKDIIIHVLSEELKQIK